MTWHPLQLLHELEASAWHQQCAAAVAPELPKVMKWMPRLQHGANCLLDLALHTCRCSRMRPVQHRLVLYLFVRMMLGYMAATSR